MSVFILDHKTLQSISRTLQHSDYMGNGGKFTLYSTVHSMGYENTEKLMRKMWILNHKAYRTRYNEQKSNFYKVNMSASHGKLLAPFQLLKSMECLYYNTPEGITADWHKNVHEQFKSILDELRVVLLHSLSEYNAAEWG